MPRYFFHLHDGVDLPDLEGACLEDDDAAMKHSAMNALAIASDDVKSGVLNLGHDITCLAHDGRQVGVTLFADVIQVISTKQSR